MFVKDPFDIAPHARRYTAPAWGALLLAAGFLGFSTAQALNAWKELRAAEERAATVRATLRAQASRSTAAPLNKEEEEKRRDRTKLHNRLALSWTSIFELLEVAGQDIDGKATVTGIAPLRLREDGAELTVSAMAASPSLMLEYLRMLERQRLVSQVQLAQQERAVAGGKEVVRFQVVLVLQSAAVLRGIAPSGHSDVRHVVLQ